MDYSNNNYWGYENLDSNSYATPNNYDYYNYSPRPPPYEPHCYNYPPPLELDPMQEQILTALRTVAQSSNENLKLIQLQNESLARMNASFEQINDVCGSNQEDYAYNQNSFQEYNHCASNDLATYESKESDNMIFDSTPPMDLDHFEPNTESFTSPSPLLEFCSSEYPTHSSPPFEVEEDCSFCNICRCLGHEREDCPGFPYYDVMSESETSDISADPIDEGNYFHEEHSICEVQFFQDDPIERTYSLIEPLIHIEHINEDSHRREEEIHLYLSQEETVPECDSDYETSIMKIQHLLESPSVVDLDSCTVNIESCLSQSIDSNPLSQEPPPHVNHLENDKNVLSWGDIETYDFIGVKHLLSHDTVRIGPLDRKSVV